MQQTLKEIFESRGTLVPDGWDIHNGKAYKTIDSNMDEAFNGRVEIRQSMITPASPNDDAKPVLYFGCTFLREEGDCDIPINPQPDNIVDAMMIADKQLIEEGIQ